MKKRILSMVLALVMVFTLLPVGVFAAGQTTITSQPKSVTVRAGETASFSITAVNATATKPLQYLWFNADKVKVNISQLTNMFSVDSFKSLFDEGYLGEGQTIVIPDVWESMNVQCVVYWIKSTGLSYISAFPNDIALSNTAFLTVNSVPICASHSLNDNLREVPAVEPSCAREGVMQYYVCNVCGQYYADEFGMQKTTPDQQKLPKSTTHQLTFVPVTPGTCDEKSIAEHWECDVCGQWFTDEAGTVKTTKLQLQNNGTKDPNHHVDVEYVAAKAGTCRDKGNIEYWYCDDCNTYFQTAQLDSTKTYKNKDATETQKDPLNHANPLEYVPALPATCDEKGHIEYWFCDDCNEYFRNQEGTIRYENKNATETPAIGHSFVWVDNGDGTHTQECEHCHVGTVSNHVVGTPATCMESATCRICGLHYGSKDMTNHQNIEYRGQTEATTTADGFTGDAYCSDCGMFISAGEVIPMLCRHTEDASIILHHEAEAATCSACENPHTGNTEYWECPLCEKCWSDEALTKEIDKDSTVLEIQEHYIKLPIGNAQIKNPLLTETKHDEYLHWTGCKYCNFMYDAPETHTMTSDLPVTCCRGHICLVCQYDDEQYDPTNHAGGTEIVNAKEPTDLRKGYTGDTKCLGCGEIIKEGREYSKPCKKGCKDTLVYSEGIEKTCYEDGIKPHYECSKCNNWYLDDAATVLATNENLVDPCTGHDLHPGKNGLSTESLANIIKRADLLPSGFSGLTGDKLTNAIVAWINGESVPGFSWGNISIDDVIDSIRVGDLDHCYDENGHWLGCQRCGMTLRDLEDELRDNGINVSQKFFEIGEYEEHYGGVATCKEKAVCAGCGEYYGELAAHRYNQDNVCTVCGDKIEGCAAPVLNAAKHSSETGAVVLSWSAVEGAEHYNVYRCETKNGTYVKCGDSKTTSFTDTTGTVGKVYYYMVVAMGENGSYGERSNKISSARACAKPTATIGYKSSTGKPVIMWDEVDGATSYEVCRSTKADSGFVSIGTTTGLKFTNTSAKIGVTYYYKVRAIVSNVSDAKSALSNVVSATCRCAQPTVTISNVASSGKIKLQWSAVDGASKYEIWRATSSGGTYSKISTVTGTSFTNTSTTAGKGYWYKIKAISSTTTAANSAYSSVVSRTCDCGQPVVKIKLSSGHPYLSWAKISGADKYYVYRATSKNGTYTKLATVTGTTYKNTSAKKGKTYYYKVVAASKLSSNANSAYSKIVSIKAK